MRTFVAALIALNAINDTTVAQGTRIDSAGIPIVQSTGKDRLLPWRFERLATIYSDDLSGVGGFTTRDELIKTDTAGRIYVLDQQDHRVHVFDASGSLVRTMGRKGSGPGEFGQPYAITVDPDGTAGVYDLQKRRLVRFSSSGAIIDERRLPGPGYSGGRIHHALGIYIYSYATYPGDLLGLYHSGARGDGLLSTTQYFRNKLLRFQSCDFAVSGLPRVFLLPYRWSAQGNRVAFATGSRYEIVIHDGHKEVVRIRRRIQPLRATSALAKQEFSGGWRVPRPTGTTVCDADEVVKLRGFEPEIPLIARVAMSPEAELWVGRGGVKGQRLPIDIFQLNGIYLGTLSPGAPFPVAFLRNGQIIAYELDEMEVGRIVIYRVIR
jgi:hypothetical protein